MNRNNKRLKRQRVVIVLLLTVLCLACFYVTPFGRKGSYFRARLQEIIDQVIERLPPGSSIVNVQGRIDNLAAGETYWMHIQITFEASSSFDPFDITFSHPAAGFVSLGCGIPEKLNCVDTNRAAYRVECSSHFSSWPLLLQVYEDVHWSPYGGIREIFLWILAALGVAYLFWQLVDWL